MNAPNPFRAARVSVEVDWLGTLPAAQLRAFQRLASQTEAFYSMFSVVLDEAISLRQRGSFEDSCKLLPLTSQLQDRMTDVLKKNLLVMAEHCKEFGAEPSVIPLDASQYSSATARRSALRNHLTSRIVGLNKKKFQRKCNSLIALAANLSINFHKEVLWLARRLPIPEANHLRAKSWAQLDSIHYDLNTCVRESVVMLKCFFRALPTEELALFQASLNTTFRTVSKPVSPIALPSQRRFDRVPMRSGACRLLCE